MRDDPQHGDDAVPKTPLQCSGTREIGNSDGSVNRCATCGTVVDTTEWHPITTWTDEDGTFHVVAFCGEECRARWVNER